VFVSVAIVVLCISAVAFYTRFLFALFRESQPNLTGHWVRLRLSSGEDTTVEMQVRIKPVTGAA
jgi:hypothetical protein